MTRKKIISPSHPTNPAHPTLNATGYLAIAEPGLRGLKLAKEAWAQNQKIVIGENLYALTQPFWAEEKAKISLANDDLTQLGKLLGEREAIEQIFINNLANPLTDLSPDKLAFVPYSVFNKTTEPRSAVEQSLGLSAFIAAINAGTYLDLTLKKIAVKEYADKSVRYALVSAGKVQTVNNEHLEEIDGKWQDLDKARFPILFFLWRQYEKYGYRTVVTALAAGEATIALFEEGGLRFGAVETTIRQTVAQTSANVKPPKNLDEAVTLYHRASDFAKKLAGKLGKEKIRETKTPQRKKQRQENQAQLTAQKHKKASRWKNDPAKQKLWDEHQKQKREKSARERKEQQALKKAQGQAGRHDQATKKPKVGYHNSRDKRQNSPKHERGAKSRRP